MVDVLVIGPHPDDVELCCGGLIAKLSESGYNVGIADLTRGELGSEGSAETRLTEAAKAAQILGVQVRDNLDLGDCRVSANFENVKKLGNVIRQHRPRLLIAPYGDGHHPDHVASRKLVDKATFLAKLRKVASEFKAHRVGMIAYYMLHRSFDPSFIVDVTRNYGKKQAAIKAYISQMPLMMGVDGLLTSIELRDQIYGAKVGVKFGEPFLSRVPLKVDDPVVFLQ
ncbi:MAG: bacillithiol biosynthesis deacetylase BshB1 [Candidatus Bathyarchaeota archaeon]|nr:MAG: bacillithiol biosynthesis deacetylase BshB1 [Candidatus Bathyarchaeota archaeon]